MSSNLPRRRFLAGAGATLALPFLESLLPAGRTARADTPVAPRRFMTFHFPIGVNRAAWKPSGTESEWTLGTSQAPLAPHKNDLCVITHVDNSSDVSGHSVHTGRMASLLTGGDVPKTAHTMSNSADQLIAQSLSGKTPFKSLELGTAILNENPNDEPGFDPVLKDHLSWAGGTPLPKEINPSALFDRLFGSGSGNPATATVRRLRQQSVIDAVREDATRLRRQVGKNDNLKLDEYLTSVRELEIRIQATGGGACTMGARPGPPADIRERVTQMLDLSVLAFRCDLTRVITFGYEHTVTNRTHGWLGVTEPYHIGITHNQPGEPYAIVNQWIVSQLAYLLAKLKATPDTTGNLLDNTIVYFVSEMGEGSAHDPRNLPIVVAGGGRGRIKGGRLLDRPGQGNANLLIALMQAMDVPVTSFGNGYTTPLPGLVST